MEEKPTIIMVRGKARAKRVTKESKKIHLY